MIGFHLHAANSDCSVARQADVEHLYGGGNLDDIHAIKKFAGMGEHLRAALVAAQMVWRL